MKKNSPLISVIMPAYNAGDFVVEATRSILTQTHSNIEFIIIDDASTDNTYSQLRSLAKKDRRIRLFRNKVNMGISETVKKAIDKTHGEYLARMDADDIAHPERLAKQLTYLQKHKGTVAVGTQCMLINKDGVIIGKKVFPTKFEDIYKYIFQFVPIQQPSLMIAKTRLPKDFEYYQDGMNTAEEIELFFKLFQYGRVENLNDYLLYYRIHDNNSSFKDIRKTFLLTLISRLKAVTKYGYAPTPKGVAITLVQTAITLILPQEITLNIYKLARNMLIQNTIPARVSTTTSLVRA